MPAATVQLVANHTSAEATNGDAMMLSDRPRTPHDFLPQIARVFTVAGRYQARGWTEWTQGITY